MRKTLIWEEKKRRKADKEMVGVGREEYCSSLRNVMREKCGVKSKEWKWLDGCWDEIMDEVFLVYLGKMK